MLVYATDGTALQGEDNNPEHRYAIAAVAQHQGPEVRDSEGPIGTQKAGNLTTAQALESAVTPSIANTLIDRQADERCISVNLTTVAKHAGSINRLVNFGPYPTKPDYHFPKRH